MYHVDEAVSGKRPGCVRRPHLTNLGQSQLSVVYQPETNAETSVLQKEGSELPQQEGCNWKSRQKVSVAKLNKSFTVDGQRLNDEGPVLVGVEECVQKVFGFPVLEDDVRIRHWRL